MSTKNIVRVSEFEKLYYDDRKPFKQKHWETLCCYLESLNRREENRVEYYRILNKGIQFTNFVGVIQAGNLTIEILPKTDKGATTAANEPIENLAADVAADKAKWQAVLLQMLRECRLLRVNHVNYANLNLRSNSILDIYLELFLAETESLSHEGLLKKYQKREGNQAALKGSLLIGKQVTRNATHAERFYVHFMEYNRDNIYNQLIYKTLRLIPRIRNSGQLVDRVGRLLLNFPEVSSCVANEETFQRLAYDRKTERYKEVLLISKMLLLNFRPGITGGSENVVAILFDMNKLWEEWVYRRLRKEEATFNIKVQRQQSADFWIAKLSGVSKKIRPDIVIYVKGHAQTIVLDTKWKIVEDLIPGDEDLKQMYIYNLYWDCNRSVLLYPAKEKTESVGHYVDYNNSSRFISACLVQTINILDSNNNLRWNFGQLLLESILRSIQITNSR